MKENIVGVVTSLGSQGAKRQVIQSIPQMKTLDKSDDFFARLGISWLPCYARGFYLKSKQIKILHDPKSFYNLLLDKIRNANRRVVLASLYLGTGTLETDLVASLNRRLREESSLVVKVLLDCIRGSRGEVNSRKMLLPLLENHTGSCQVSLYQTPVLREPFLSLMPERYKEVVGLQHMKVYLFDNDLIISGANLSTDYFTNRQDRYILVQGCKELADFMEGFVQKVSEMSLQLNSKDELNLHSEWVHHPVQSKREKFIEEARSQLRSYYKSYPTNSAEGDFDTVIFPLFEMGHFDINMDSTVTTRILGGCGDGVSVSLTTGYFNLTGLYTDCIINKSRASYDILMAHPTTNGFYKAKGPAGGVPFAYTDLASQFLRKVIESRQTNRINMYEYVRPGWTYHAKGLWLATKENGLPFITMVGSPNFGERSITRDLECQFLLATESEDLQRELLVERDRLYRTSESFTESTSREAERVAPMWVKAVVYLFRSFL